MLELKEPKADFSKLHRNRLLYKQKSFLLFSLQIWDFHTGAMLYSTNH